MRCQFCNNIHDGLRCERGATISIDTMFDRIEELEGKLDRINRTIFSVGAPLGSNNYFVIRELTALDR